MGAQSHIRSSFKVVIIALGASLLINAMRRHFNYHDTAPNPEMCDDIAKTYEEKAFTTFEEFYPFYLCEHTKPATKLFHFVGTTLYLADMGAFVMSGLNPTYLLTAAVKAYGLAWTSHFFIEQNKPATFKYPFFSFMGDHQMFMDLSTMRLRMW